MELMVREWPGSESWRYPRQVGTLTQLQNKSLGIYLERK